jgi:hypothetical protein
MFNGTSLQIERDEDSWIEFLKECYDKLDFDNELFYFGMEATVKLLLQGELEPMTDKENIFAYFKGEIEKIRQSGQDCYTEIVILQKSTPHVSLLP